MTRGFAWLRQSTGQVLCRVCSVAARGNAAFPKAELALLGKLLQWPADRLFPARDIARLAVLHEAAQAHLAATAGPLELSPLGALPLPGSLRRLPDNTDVKSQKSYRVVIAFVGARGLSTCLVIGPICLTG